MLLYNLLDNWNDAGTVFKAIALDVTDTASDAGSLIMELGVNSNPALQLFKSGELFLTRVGTPHLTLVSGADKMTLGNNAGWFIQAPSLLTLQPAGGNVSIASGNLALADSSRVYWGSSSTYLAGNAALGTFTFSIPGLTLMELAPSSFTIGTQLKADANSVGFFILPPPGANTVGIADGSPSGAPTSGGYFYVSAGELHWVGSAGTDTVIAPA